MIGWLRGHEQHRRARGTRGARLVRALVCCAVALPLPVNAAGAGAPPPKVANAGDFGETVDVRIVNVDVYVTDRDGHPVNDLSASDFAVTEDGRKVAIANFTTLQEPAPGARSTAGAAAQSAGAASPPIAAAEPLVVALYFDDEFLRPPARTRALAQLRAALPRLVRPEDTLVVFTAQPSPARGPHRGADLEALLGALERGTPGAIQRDVDRRSSIDTMRQIFETSGCAHELQAVARAHASDEESAARAALASLEDAVEQLGALPGMKSLFFISEGIPARPGEELSAIIGEWCDSPQSFAERDLTDRLRRVGALANARRVTLFTFEAGGLKSTSAGTTDFAQNIVSFAADRVRIEGQQDSLTHLAAETGGVAVLNSNELGPSFDRVAVALRNHYSLAFVPLAKVDGKEHRIRVQVARKHLVLRYRRSYLSPRAGS